MSKRRLTLFAYVALLLLLVPLLFDLWLIGKDVRHSRLVEEYECRPEVCEADFDGDGQLGHVLFDRAAAATPYIPGTPKNLAWIVVIDGGRQLMRFPYRHVDDTLRSHIGINREFTRSHLLIYNRIGGEGAPPNGTFAFDGEGMVQIDPSPLDQDILGAMAARDDTGTWEDWSLFRALHVPIVLFYYLPLTGLIIWVLRLKYAQNIKLP